MSHLTRKDIAFLASVDRSPAAAERKAEDLYHLANELDQALEDAGIDPESLDEGLDAETDAEIDDRPEAVDTLRRDLRHAIGAVHRGEHMTEVNTDE